MKAETVKYLRWDGNASAFPAIAIDEPFKALIIAEKQVVPSDRLSAAQALVRAGVRYVCTWGEACEAWHDAIDEAAIRVGLESLQDEKEWPFVITTWHHDESLEDTVWFLKKTVAHPDFELSSCLLFHVSIVNREQEFVQIYTSCD